MLISNTHGERCFDTQIIFKPLCISQKDIMRAVPLTEVSVGDKIRLDIDGKEYEGILMPHHRFSGKDIITLKLDNGYNMGIKIKKGTMVTLVERKREDEKIIKVPKVDNNRPKISIIGTGGTIASYVEYTTGAVHPAETAAEMLYSNPDIADRCTPKVKIILSKLSEDMVPGDWIDIAEAVTSELNSGAEGVVIAHGTDTMGYTAAALSFLLDELPKPVVLVGSQRSSDRPSSDAHLNLLAAIELAKSNVCGVYVVMHKTVDDKICSIHLGTRIRKMHTSRRDAFKSINSMPVGWVEPMAKKIILKDLPEKNDGDATRIGGIEPDVALIYVTPALSEDDLLYAAGKKGIVLVGTGLGHLNSDLIPTIKEIIREGIPVVMTSQCIHGTVNCHVYSNGRKLLEAGVIPCGDILPETALVKLMWCLTLDGDIRELMTTNIVGELGSRRMI